MAAGWAVAAWLLWRTSVPDLDLPDLAPGRFFDPATLDEAADYERFLRIDGLAAVATLLVVLGVYAWRGHVFVRESAAGRIGTGMLLGMLGLALVWLSQLPFGLLALWWDRRHDLSDYGYVEWLFDDWWLLAGEFLFISLAMLVVVGLAGPLGDRWWLAAAPAFTALALLFAFVAPYLAEPVLEPAPHLAAEARALAARQGEEAIPVRVEEVGADTSLPNAYAFGLGPSRRVVLWDTLLDGRFSDAEVDVVLAHELGHHWEEHIWKLVGWFGLFALPGTAIVALVTRRRGGMRAPEAVPLGLFVVVVLQLLAAPVFNEFSRRLEAEADWVALETTRDPESARRLFEQFAELSLAEPSPPSWAYVLEATHPSIMERIAMTEAWRARQADRSAAG